jgi:hypothetical protein
MVCESASPVCAPTIRSASSPSAKTSEGRNPLDFVLARERLELIYVDFQDRSVSICGECPDRRLHHLTWPTPVGIEVDEHDVVVVDDIVELVGVTKLDRFGWSCVRV